jgi:ABC-type transport system involved in cytochrome c biogenesis permease subunit
VNLATRYLPWGIITFAAVYLAIAARPPRDEVSAAHVHQFGKLLVVDRGRIKPIDTLARTSLMVISGRQTYAGEKTESADKWLLDVMTGSQRDREAIERAFDQKVFRIEDPRLVQILKLKENPDSLYSLKELGPHLELIWGAARKLAGDEAGQRTPGQRMLAGLAQATDLYVTLAGRQDKVFRIENDQLLMLLDLQRRAGYRYAVSEFLPKIGPFLQEYGRVGRLEPREQTVFEQKVVELGQHLALYHQLTQPLALFVIPPGSGSADWQKLGNADDKNEMAQSWESMLDAYRKDKPAEFNKAVARCTEILHGSQAEDQERGSFETLFNSFAPFYQCAVLYVIVLVLASLGWLPNLGFLQRSAFWLGVFVLAIHTAALIARMYLSDRWLVFVTNLYSSAVFIGWMSVVLGLVLERIYRNGIGNMLVGLTGFSSLVVAHHLASSGDTLEMLQAVLDTNFWLATHVTSVTIGYAATLVAGFLGLIYIGKGVLTSSLTREAQKSLSQMIYGILCFATLFSFVGTVLGGIWADQSWGRFWGWDPKENGALLIVLWNALILHARWGGLVKQRGIAVLAVVGNMVTGWSWFGTNQLGVGLHAYGFNNTLALGLTVFWIINLTFIGLGLLPKWMWQSLRPQLPASSNS